MICGEKTRCRVSKLDTGSSKDLKRRGLLDERHIAWAILFSAAATYIELGQGIESAIPISILAVGFSVAAVRFLHSRGSTLLENVNVLALGAWVYWDSRREARN